MAEALKETVSSAWTGVKRGLSSAPPNDAYLAWDAPGVETIRPDEQEKIQRIKEVMERMQKHNFDLHRHAFRATHIKTQGIVKGKLQVHPDLPEHLRQGIFAAPGKTYDFAARYANELYLLQRDQEPGPRGLGLKVFGVTGPRLEGVDELVNTQDFFWNNAPSIELTDVDTTLDIMSLREKYLDDPAALGRHLKLRRYLLRHSTVPDSTSFSHERRVFWEDHMSLDAWRGLAAHRPLGGINRLRKGVYQHSKKTRDKINVSKSGDIRGIDEIP